MRWEEGYGEGAGESDHADGEGYGENGGERLWVIEDDLRLYA